MWAGTTGTKPCLDLQELGRVWAVSGPVSGPVSAPGRLHCVWCVNRISWECKRFLLLSGTHFKGSSLPMLLSLQCVCEL